MRLDKFLKVSRIIKRRTVSQDIAKNKNVKVNGNSKKPSYQVKPNDILEIKIYDQIVKVKILDIPEKNIKKDEVEKIYQIMEIKKET